MSHVGAGERTVSARTMEMVVAGAFLALACVIMADNWRIGARWGDDGPQAGYFPFRVGAIMFLASLVTLITHLRARASEEGTFVERSQLKQVLQVLIPTIVFVAAITFLGIYVSAAIFIAVFMAWLGKYPIHKIAPVALLVPVVLFLMFEIWFLVPLPKGPLETAFGY
jgi:putative tricarboxylic transport membrane protein